jgi:hypothetical protein
VIIRTPQGPAIDTRIQHTQGEVKDGLSSLTQLKSTEDFKPAANTDDAVSLSPAATNYTNSIFSFSAYFPTRSGMSSDALAVAVVRPGAVSSSKEMTFDEVGADARKRINDRYALMSATGTPYDGSDKDRNSLMSDLDRRSLYAVVTNQGGRFQPEEQAAARGLMRQQERLATGYFEGPPEQHSHHVDPYASDPIGRVEAALAFLEKLSGEEKAAPQWLIQHQTLSDALTQTEGGKTTSVAKDQGHFLNLSEILAGVEPPSAKSGKSASDLSPKVGSADLSG